MQISLYSGRLGLLSLFLLTLAFAQPPSVRPNVLIVISDDQGWGDLGFHGNPVVYTPNLDRMARTGTVFDRFYVDAVCSPTRASLLTGRYAVRGGVYSTSAGGERLDLDETTFASVLQDAGYITGAFGKWHNGSQPPYHPNYRGFGTFVGYTSGHWGSYVNAMLEENGQFFQSEGYLTDYLTKRALSFIEANKDTSWLTYLALNTPHSPMQVPDSLWARYEKLALPSHRYQERENADHTRAAYAMVENIDQNMGKLLRKLDSLDLSRQTLIIFLSDNGPNGWRWNGGMEGTKGKVEEGGLRVPMLVTGLEEFLGGNRISSISSAMDVFPTLLELCEIPLPTENALDGKSLLPLLSGDLDEERVLVQHWQGKTGVRTQQYRLSNGGELYDMQEDEGQRMDLSDSLPHIRDSLMQIRRLWEEEVFPELPLEDLRPFPIMGDRIHLPARDAEVSGGIQRSNRWPNCSFYTRWEDRQNSIYWQVEVQEEGWFIPTLYYTHAGDTSLLSLHWQESQVEMKLDHFHTPPLEGARYDRVPRGESYVKQWAEKDFPPIYLGSGNGNIRLRKTSTGIGPEVRLIVLSRVQD